VIEHPLIRYHGSKWRIAPWIIGHFPPHRIYVEPFGGSASVLLNKVRAEVEVYNDLDGEICNLMRVVRDRGAELAQKVYFTPYCREEFVESFEATDDPVEQARRTIVRAFQGWGSGYATNTSRSKCGKPYNSFRIGWRVPGNLPQKLWLGVPENIMSIIERLRGVVIESLPYQEVIKKNDTPETLVYADPPYMAETRDRGNDYRHEFAEADHVGLAKILNKRPGPAVVSGYHSALYEDLYHGWRVFKKEERSVGNTARTEVIWVKGYNKRGLFD
jgi:DNA adenine methylase